MGPRLVPSDVLSGLFTPPHVWPRTHGIRMIPATKVDLVYTSSLRVLAAILSAVSSFMSISDRIVH